MKALTAKDAKYCLGRLNDLPPSGAMNASASR